MPPSHVTSLELAKELRENGWPQEGSAFAWVKNLDDEEWHVSFRQDWPGEPDNEWVAAPLASELWEKLKPGLKAWYQTAPDYWNACWGDNIFFQDKNSLPNAIAKLAIHLIKEGKMKV